MKRKSKKYLTWSIILIAVIVLADQILKFWVKLNMRIGQEIPILGKRIKLLFIENPGMAFGMQFTGDHGKLILTLLRIVAVIVIFIIIVKLSKLKSTKKGLIIALSLIVAGALGNILDSLFYGVIFSESTPFNVAELFPKGGGYSSFLHGKVVDMFYCPIITGHYPNWFPFVGGNYFEFFRPIFNIADSSITIGVFWLIFGYKTFFKKQPNKTESETSATADNTNNNTINEN